jgi:hypothetical protein
MPEEPPHAGGDLSPEPRERREAEGLRRPRNAFQYQVRSGGPCAVEGRRSLQTGRSRQSLQQRLSRGNNDSPLPPFRQVFTLPGHLHPCATPRRNSGFGLLPPSSPRKTMRFSTKAPAGTEPWLCHVLNSESAPASSQPLTNLPSGLIVFFADNLLSAALAHRRPPEAAMRRPAARRRDWWNGTRNR